MKATFILTHEMTVETGEIPPVALAEYLKTADVEASSWDVWAIASQTNEGTAKLTGIEVVD